MKTGASLKNRQGGAVAVMVGISMVMLIGFLALVLDLGHLYIAKTELQNASDAAALAGAKELNGSAAGVTSGVNRAIATAAQNNYDFSKPVDIAIAHISVGSCPSDACMVPASSVTTDTAAADKTFLKVDTEPRPLGTWVAPIFSMVTGGNYGTTRTFGMAVAGRHVVDISPIAICQLPDDPANAYDNELGFERGVSYKVSDANPIGPGTMFWIDPESNTPGVCTATSTNDTLPYVCTGKVSYTPVVGQTVNTNTGISIPQLRALDSRFGDYPPSAGCNPATAPADRNVKTYNYDAAGAGPPSDWMTTNPNKQSILFVDALTGGRCRSGPCRPKLRALRSITDYGVLWSAYRPVNTRVSDWLTLYGEAAATYPPPLVSYPGSSPYAQTATSTHPQYFDQPPLAYRPGVAGRRVLNMTIINCSTRGGVCRPATVLGAGKFFMQRRATQPDHEVHVEFGGLLPTPFNTADIRLYR